MRYPACRIALLIVLTILMAGCDLAPPSVSTIADDPAHPARELEWDERLYKNASWNEKTAFQSGKSLWLRTCAGICATHSQLRRLAGTGWRLVLLF